MRGSTAPVPSGRPASWTRAMSLDLTYRHLGRSGLLVSPIRAGHDPSGLPDRRGDQCRHPRRRPRRRHRPRRAQLKSTAAANPGHGPGLRPLGGDHRPLSQPHRAARRHRRWRRRGLPANGAGAPTTAGCPPTTFDGRARQACADSRPTTSTCTRCTTSTATPRGKRSGRPRSSSYSTARSTTSAAATSRAGTSPPPKLSQLADGYCILLRSVRCTRCNRWGGGDVQPAKLLLPT